MLSKIVADRVEADRQRANRTGFLHQDAGCNIQGCLGLIVQGVVGRQLGDFGTIEVVRLAIRKDDHVLVLQQVDSLSQETLEGISLLQVRVQSLEVENDPFGAAQVIYHVGV